MSNNDFDIDIFGENNEGSFTSLFSSEVGQSVKDKLDVTTEMIDVDRIQMNPNNEYNEDDSDLDLQLLAESERALGSVDINPIAVTRLGKSGKKRNEYMIQAGERRFRAATEINHWKQIKCVVFPYDTKPELIALLFEGTNLFARNVSPEKQFAGYLRLIKALENNPEMDNFVSLSKKKKAEFEKIIKNSSSEMLEQFENEELSFKDLKDAAEYQRKMDAAQKRFNDAVRVFAEAKSDVSSKFYLDNKNKCVLYVDEKNDKNDSSKYGVKSANYETKMFASWVMSRELPGCDDKNTMQIFLDKYAIKNNLEETTAEEYLALMKVKEEEKKPKSEQKKAPTNKNNKPRYPEIASFTDDFVVPETKEDDISEEEKNKLISSFESDKSNTENTAHNTTDSEESKQEQFNIIEEQSIEDIKAEAQKRQPEIDELKNRYALELLFEGIELESGEKKIGRLVVDNKEHRYFIVASRVSVDKVIDERSGKEVLNATLRAFEVDSKTVRIVERNKQ